MRKIFDQNDQINVSQIGMNNSNISLIAIIITV